MEIMEGMKYVGRQSVGGVLEIHNIPSWEKNIIQYIIVYYNNIDSRPPGHVIGGSSDPLHLFINIMPISSITNIWRMNMDNQSRFLPYRPLRDYHVNISAWCRILSLK